MGALRSKRASSERYWSAVQHLSKFLNWARVHFRLLKFGGTCFRSYGEIKWNKIVMMCVNFIEKRARKNQSF